MNLAKLGSVGACLALLWTSPANADYQTELSAAAIFESIDNGDEIYSPEYYSLEVMHYLAPVETKDIPVQLAGFISKQSFIGAQTVQRHERDRDEGNGVYTAFGNVRIGGTPFRLGISGSWDTDPQDAVYMQGAQVGGYVNETGLVEAAYFISDEAALDSSRLDVRYRQVVKLADKYASFFIGRSETKNTFNDPSGGLASESLSIEGWSLGARFFPSNQFGVGVSVTRAKLDSDFFVDEKREQLAFEATYDPSTRLGVILSYVDSSAKADQSFIDYEIGTDQVGLTIQYRL